MFLVRAAFWILIVMALLPDQRDAFLARWPALQQEAQARGVDDWLEQSVERAQDLADLCRRQPDLCRDASAVWQGTWNQAYARVQQVLQHFGRSEEHIEPLRRRNAPAGTLSPLDLEPAWNAPKRGQNA